MKYKNCWLPSLAFCFITESDQGSDLISKIEVIEATSVLQNCFPYQE